MARGRPAKRYPVDGCMLTIREAAEKAGVSEKAFRIAMSRIGGGPQAALNAYKSGMIVRAGDQAARGCRNSRVTMHEGRWLTMKEFADLAGVSEKAFRSYVCHNRMTPAEALEYYRTRTKVRHGGAGPKIHRVNGRNVTVKEVAARIGTSAHSLRVIMSRYKCSLQAAAARVEATHRKWEARKTERAVAEILRTLME